MKYADLAQKQKIKKLDDFINFLTKSIENQQESNKTYLDQEAKPYYSLRIKTDNDQQIKMTNELVKFAQEQEKIYQNEYLRNAEDLIKIVTLAQNKGLKTLSQLIKALANPYHPLKPLTITSIAEESFKPLEIRNDSGRGESLPVTPINLFETIETDEGLLISKV